MAGAAALGLLVVAAGAYVGYRHTVAETAGQVRVVREGLRCHGDDVRVGSHRIAVSGPDVACTGRIHVVNDSGRDVHVTGVTFAFAGPGNSHAVLITSIDGDPDVDSDGREGVEAGLGLDVDVAAGTSTRIPYAIAANPGQCDPGETVMVGAWPSVGLDVMHHHVERTAGRFRMVCS